MAGMSEFASFVENCFGQLEGITVRSMFGAYVIHFRGRVLGFIIDDRLLLQDVPPIRELLPEADRVPLFPGSKDFVIFEDLWNRPLLYSICEAVYDNLPVPKPRGKRGGRTGDGKPKGGAAGPENIPEKAGLSPEIKDFLEFHKRNGGK